MTAKLPPAVVLGIDSPIGLAIVRALGRHGVSVTGIARGPGAPGLASRYLERGLLRAADEEGTLRQLETLRRELGAPCLYAISESDINMLNRHRARLSGYRLLFPDDARMRQVLDKNLTYAAAERAGVPVPRSVQPESAAQVRAAAPTLHYPVVLKWADPNGVIKLLSEAGLACDKLRYCHSAEELLAYLQPYDAVQRYPLIQEYCAGYGLGQFLLMRDGQPLCAFQHRRLHEWPPEGGVSTQCVSVPLSQHGELMQQSVALLRAMQWDGIAMVEYRHDPVSGKSMLMEVNGRFWGSLPLACHAGVEFPWLLYLSHGLDQPVRQPTYAGGLRCRFMIPETRRLLRLLLRPDLVADRHFRTGRMAALWHYLRDFLRPRMRYFVFDWGDPAPLWRDLSHALLRRR